MGIDTKYLSTREVAERLGVSVMSVSRWVRSGKLIGYRFGKTIRISEEDLSQFIEKSRIAKLPNDEETDKPDLSTGKSVLEHWGTWSGPKEEYYKIIEAIKESRSDAEF